MGVTASGFIRKIDETDDLRRSARKPLLPQLREALLDSTLTRQIRRATGYPPNEYLLRLRLKKSVMLLLNPELSISEIAERTGFSDSNYFCRQFRNHYGTSPQKYRKRK